MTFPKERIVELQNSVGPVNQEIALTITKGPEIVWTIAFIQDPVKFCSHPLHLNLPHAYAQEIFFPNPNYTPKKGPNSKYVSGDSLEIFEGYFFPSKEPTLHFKGSSFLNIYFPFQINAVKIFKKKKEHLNGIGKDTMVI